MPKPYPLSADEIDKINHVTTLIEAADGIGLSNLLASMSLEEKKSVLKGMHNHLRHFDRLVRQPVDFSGALKRQKRMHVISEVIHQTVKSDQKALHQPGIELFRQELQLITKAKTGEGYTETIFFLYNSCSTLWSLFGKNTAGTNAAMFVDIATLSMDAIHNTHQDPELVDGASRLLEQLTENVYLVKKYHSPEAEKMRAPVIEKALWLQGTFNQKTVNGPKKMKEVSKISHALEQFITAPPSGQILTGRHKTPSYTCTK